MTPKVDIEFLPSNNNKDRVSKIVFANLNAARKPSDTIIFNPTSEEFSCSAELVDRQILTDVQELLDHRIDPSNNRTFLSVVRYKTTLFANIIVVKTYPESEDFEYIGGLVYQIEDGCDSIRYVRSDNY